MPDPVLSDNLINLFSGSDLAETIVAVNGFITAGLEGDFGGLAALGAGGRKHLAFADESAAITLGFP